MVFIYKGDDVDFAGKGEISVSILSVIDITGFTGRFEFMGVVKDFPADVIAKKSFSFTYSSEETEKFCLGKNFGIFTLFDTKHRKAVVARILVEVLPATCCGGCGNNGIFINMVNNGSYNTLADKPSINGVTIIGDKTAEEYGLATLGDIQDEQDRAIGREDELEREIRELQSTFRGTFATWSDVPDDLAAYIGGEVDANDYIVVEESSDYPGNFIDSDEESESSEEPKRIAGCWRFAYVGKWAEAGKDGWYPEYELGERDVVKTVPQELTEDEKAQARQNIGISDVLDDIADIKDKIPAEATKDNQLADKEWVEQKVDENSAYYITSNAAGDAFATKEALENAEEYWSGGAPRTPTRNDYAVVQNYEGTQWRFIYTVPQAPAESSDSDSSEEMSGRWEPQYPLNSNLDRIVSPDGDTEVVVRDEGNATLERTTREQCMGWVISNRVTGAEIATLTDSSSEIQEGYLVEKWTGKDAENHDVTVSFIWQGDTFIGGSLRISPYTYARIDAFTDDTHTKFNAIGYGGEKKQVEVVNHDSAVILTEHDIIAPADAEAPGKAADALAVEEALRASAGVVQGIQDKIPKEATEDNQLADKNYVNNAVATSSATFIGTSEAATKAEFVEWLETLDADNNDYVFWKTADSGGNTVYKRYKYSDADDSSEEYSGPLPASDFPITWDNGRVDLSDADTLIWGPWGEGGKVLKTADELIICYFNAEGRCKLRPDQVISNLAFAGRYAVDGEWPVLEEGSSDSSEEPLAGHWLFEYEFNNTSFSPEQWDAINSGITAETVKGIRLKDDLTVYTKTTDFTSWEFASADAGEPPLPEGELAMRWLEAQGRWEFLVDGEPSGASGTSTEDAERVYVLTTLGSPQRIVATREKVYEYTPTEDSLTKKSDIESLLFAQYYPEGNVKSAAEFTQGIKYDDPDTTNRTITVKPFCNTGDSENDNSSLVGRVVIPPFVDGDGNPYISDDGTRYKVVGVGGFSGLADSSTNLTAIVAPSTVTTIGEGAFYSCAGLASVSLPAAETVGAGAFFGCTSIVSVSLPNASGLLGDNVFAECTSLRSVYIPHVDDLSQTFTWCRALESVDFGDASRPAVPDVSPYAFDAVPTTCKIIVPDAQYDDWIAATDGWESVKLGATPAALSKRGSLAYAYARGNYTVDGIEFSAASGSSGIDNEDCSVNIAYAAGNVPPSDVEAGGYKNLLSNGWWSSAGSKAVTLKSLTAGHSYLVQIVMSRSDYQTQTATSPDGEAVAKFGGAGWEYGGMLSGIFMATDSTETLSIAYSGNSWLNGIQVRDLGASVQGHNYWHDLYIAGYKFLRHSEWEYARKYELDGKADKDEIPDKLPSPQALKFVDDQEGTYDSYDGSVEKTIDYAKAGSFGLVRLSDRTDWNRTAASGAFAATPAAIKAVSDALAGKLDKMEAIAWSDLKVKRDGGNLVPGQQYRITDYVATTNGDMESNSANHPFDIIVTADAENKLNESARAVMHEDVTAFSSVEQYAVGDFVLYSNVVYKCTVAHEGAWNADHFTQEAPYFYGCNLAAWELKYCLDNDASRFAWADANGKGVVYRMMDEFQNDCPYDFKGIQFKAYGDTDDVWRYTFDSGDASNNTDLSKSGLERHVYKNTIRLSNGQWGLCRIVFKGPVCYDNTFGVYCHSNTFGSNCHSNTFDANCSFNTFGEDCSVNKFGANCQNNAFGAYCSDNAFDTNCSSNTFGEGCSYNAFGAYCSYNAFGAYCSYNAFGSDCSTNAFGAYCSTNAFGAACTGNAFGSGCSVNAFGAYCSSNMFGPGCSYNAFGAYCSTNAFGSGCYVGTWSNYSQRYVGTVVEYSNVLRTVKRRYRGSFSASQVYRVGETLYYQSKYWECATVHGGAWNQAHFTEIQLVGGILSAEEYVPLSYYRYVELEDGVSYVALDCTADRGSGVYYQNVTVSKGIGGAESAPKHIEDARYSQMPKTTYQPADSQVISV